MSWSNRTRTSRRDLLAVGATAITASIGAGCSTSRGTADIEVRNKTESEQTVSITVTQSEENTIITEFEGTARIPENESKKFVEPRIFFHEIVTIDVHVEDGPSTSRRWDVTTSLLIVRLFEDRIEFEKYGATRPEDGFF